MPLPILYGAAYSVYVRAARLALAEKGVAYKLVEVDIFGAVPDWYARLHPFGRIPAFEHDGFRLYEAGAIMRYVDEAFGPSSEHPALMPTDARGRARVAQIMSVADAYLYRPLVWDIYVERCDAPADGRAPDEAKIAAAIPCVATCFAAIEALMAPQDSKSAGPYVLGAQLTLADLHLAPMISIGVRAAEGAALLARRPRLAAWWSDMRQRPSLAATATRPEA